MSKSRARKFADLLDGNDDIKGDRLSNAQAFASGTLMLFQQTSAPTGWTKQTTHNDKALRVVSGSCSSGGTTAFSTAMATPSVSGSVGISGSPASGNLAVSVSGNVNIGSTTLSANQIPSHRHYWGVANSAANNNGGNTANNKYNFYTGSSSYGKNHYGNANYVRTNTTGGNGSHNHSAGHNLSGSMTGAPSVGNLAGSLSSATASINLQYVDMIIASKD